MQCDMCGSNGPLFVTEVEGTKLELCKGCSKFGKVLHSKRAPPTKKQLEKKAKIQAKQAALPEVEVIELIVEDFAAKIKKGREFLGLKQAEFAKRISEKESLVQNIESGKQQPSIALAKKLEKFLKVRLVEEHEEEYKKNISETPKKKSAYTLGDFVKTRKK